MKFQILLVSLVIGLNLSAINAAVKTDYKKFDSLTDKQKGNIVQFFKVEPGKELKNEERIKLSDVIAGVIEKVAIKILDPDRPSTTTTPATTAAATTTTPAATAAATTKDAKPADATTTTKKESKPTDLATTTKKESKPTDPTTTTSKEAPPSAPQSDSNSEKHEEKLEAAAAKDATTQAPTTKKPIEINLDLIFVVENVTTGLDFSNLIKFVVENNGTAISADDFKKHSEDLEKGIINDAKTQGLEVSVGFLSEGLATWAIVLIVIAVFLVVGVIGYFGMKYLKKRRGSAF